MRVTGAPFHPFTSCSNSAPAPVLPLNMRCLPTMPLLFARPFGKRFDDDMKSRRGVSAPLAHRNTARARWRTSRRSLSKYTTPVTRPRSSVSTFRTLHSERSSQRPDARASGTIVKLVPDLAPHSQGKYQQKPQLWHPWRPLYGREAIAIGAGSARQPIFFAATSSSTPGPVTSSGGIGYWRDRRPSLGSAPPCPETPIAHSTAE